MLRYCNILKYGGRFNVSRCARYSTQYTYHIPVREDEYNDSPVYPKICKVGKIAEKEYELEEWYNKIKRQETVEEKLFEVNVPRFWGWKCLQIKEDVIPYNAMDFVQHITRTHIIQTKEFPDQIPSLVEMCSQLSKDLRRDVEDSILYQLDVVRQHYKTKSLEKKAEEDETAALIVNTLDRTLSNLLSKHGEHIKTLQTDYKPRQEAFWSAGGLEVPATKLKERKNDEDKRKEEWDLPMDRWLQYVASPLLKVRHQHPLPQVIDQDAALVESYPIPSFSLDPIVLGYETERRHGTNNPGFWPGESREFPFLAYHNCNHANYRPPSYPAEDAVDVLCCQAILASFSWLLSLACYQGFSPFHDPTYPTTTQTVLTDGKQFTLAKYQLNTTLMHAEHIRTNPRVNLCWITPTMRLFEEVSEGQLIGFNEEVLARLIQLYLSVPAIREGVELKPYLGSDVKRIADIEEDKRRIWLEREFKHFSSNRPRHRLDLKYEIYDWEQIYKIDHNTRPMDARRRPFELKQKPYHKPMSSFKGPYIPRPLRPDADLPKWRQKKFEPTFYPK